MKGKKLIRYLGIGGLSLLGGLCLYLRNHPESIINLKHHQPVIIERELNTEKREQLEQDIEKYLKEHEIKTPEEAIQYSLAFTDQSADFRWRYFLGEKGKNYFFFQKEPKRTDCRDYAYLLAETIKIIGEKTNTSLEAECIRSEGYILGRKYDNHDWVRIKDLKTGEMWYMDPIFHDYGINANIGKVVK